MKRTFLLAASLSALLIGQGSAHAAGSASAARIDDIGNIGVALGACPIAGYRVFSDKIDGAVAIVTNELIAQGMTEDAISTAIDAALTRNQEQYGSDFKAVTTALGGDPKSAGYAAAAKAAVNRYAQNVATRCERAAKDPVFGKAFAAPVGASRADMLDNLAAQFGQASFQPPEAMAQGDLLYTLGKCRALLSPADVTFYQGDVLDGPMPADPAKARLRRWYQQQLQDGLDRAGKLSLEECRTMLPNLRADLKARKAG